MAQRRRDGRALATEAAAAALDWTWSHVDTDRVISLIQPDNVRSIRVAEKLGQSRERTEVVSGAEMHVFAVARPTDL